ncbi:DUF6391 domain-containing protein [Gloeobacter kilaueensis]|uniref:Uncharacterized protein n=1 Tax=Gloeobacter kilaueensis (strain ATCC BAA-2537 / CCAP 1431/1 / ULC 316 / JS1) TaxID=1183438 RepID=U5QDT4_GLOK1|nr:DUF6391 domain-containing protein [Gloeobacter kilaueensis]AGY57076.1 hypothetical protein GKIL_0830 [Gloeobacter kilaueensis JS1]
MTDSSQLPRRVTVERDESPLSTVQNLIERIRQVHALEHATIWVLSEQLPEVQLSGFSTDRGFFIYGPLDTGLLLRASHQALERINRGEENLAIHPRCGTNLSVGMLITATVGLGASLLLPRKPLPQLLAIGAAAATASQLATGVGALAQRHLTTSIPRNLEIVNARTLSDWAGRHSHFVETRYVG